MDLTGSWNPPESWPESSPPLPGWERLPNGSWHNPHAEDPEADAASTQPDTADAQRRPVPDTPTASIPSLDTLSGDHEQPSAEPARERAQADSVATTPATNVDAGVAARKPTPALQFATTEAIYVVSPVDEAQLRRRAIGAAIVSALLTVMIGGGLVVLLAIL